MLPDWLLWLLPVPVATCAAVGWTAWRSRTRGPGPAQRSVREHERFRAALAVPLPQPSGEPAPGRD